MALRNLFSLVAMATCALILSANTESATALSIDSHGHHVARHVIHDTIAKKRRSNSKRCKARPTATPSTSHSATTTAKSTTTTKPSSSSSGSGSYGSGSGSGSGSDSGSGSSNSGSTGSSGSGGSSGSSGSESGLSRGLAWAVDNNWAPTIANKPQIKWFHHWADGPVDQMPDDVEFVPVFWGTSAYGKWNQRVAEMKKKQPKHVMGFNEPDIDGQANMSPQDAAGVWMKEIHPWGLKGVKLVSPQVAFDLEWLETFLKIINQQGGWVDAIAIHWYGDFRDLSSFQSYVQKAHDKFGKPVWIPECGLTTASGASEGDALAFMQKAIGWLETQSYVDRIAWFGAFAQNNPPDGFATGKNALFYGQNSLTSLGNWYGSSG